MPRRYGHCYIGGSSLVLGAFTSPFPLLSHLWQYRGDVHQGNNLHSEWADPRKSREYRILERYEVSVGRTRRRLAMTITVAKELRFVLSCAGLGASPRGNCSP